MYGGVSPASDPLLGASFGAARPVYGRRAGGASGTAPAPLASAAGRGSAASWLGVDDAVGDLETPKRSPAPY